MTDENVSMTWTTTELYVDLAPNMHARVQEKFWRVRVTHGATNMQHEVASGVCITFEHGVECACEWMKEQSMPLEGASNVRPLFALGVGPDGWKASASEDFWRVWNSGTGLVSSGSADSLEDARNCAVLAVAEYIETMK